MDHLQPALPSVDAVKEISPQDFQQLLNTWFEEKGIVSELRSHAKFQMINALKNTSLGKKLYKSSSQTSTLAQQALHLVVAEYLLQNHCHYSFSLFSSEVNLAKIFPDSKLLFDATENQDNQPSPIFDKENLTNILELIGIPKTSKEYKNLIHTYFGSKKKYTVLNCLLDMGSPNKNEDEGSEEIEIDLEDDFLQKAAHILLSSNIPQKTYCKIILEIKKCYELKRKSFEDQCLKLITKFREELNLRNRKLHSCNKRKKRLEKQLVKSAQEQNILKEKVSFYEFKELQKTETPREDYKLSCGLEHCSENCKITKETCENYQKENERLKDKTNSQTYEIKKLKKNYNHLKEELTNCQTKINLLKLKMQDQTMSQSTANSSITGHNPKSTAPSNSKKVTSESSETSSNNLTDEVLREARQKLKELEEESEQIDLKYKRFIIR